MRMPVLKHAKKKQRQDKRRTADNLKIKQTFKKLIKYAKENPTKEALNAAYAGIDKAAKKNVIHKNKAARLKSSIAKTVNKPAEKKTTAPKKTTKTTGKKRASKKTAKKSSTK